MNGFRYAWRAEQNIRVHVVFGIFVVSMGWVCNLSLFEWIAIFFAMGLVVAFELVNSACEAFIDISIPRVSDAVRHIKDMLAAAVLVASLTALVIGILVFFPHLYDLFGVV
jgi:undecaprenol kinase/diacylglycerol kinase (ATP)